VTLQQAAFFDAGPLIHLAELGLVDLLNLFKKRYSTKQANAIFVSDDSAARLSSDTLKIESVGTLGIIIKGGTLGLIQICLIHVQFFQIILDC